MSFLHVSVRRGLLLAVLWGVGTASAQPAASQQPAASARRAAASGQPVAFSWDVPRVLEWVEMPGVMRADGIPVKLRSVKSAEKPQVILQHLVDRFEAAGFYIPPDHHRTQWLAEPQLTALDTDRLISYTFVLQPNPDGSTTVVLGEANLGLARREQSAFAPVFPGGTDLMQSEMEGARTMTYLAAAEQDKVRDFYLKELRGAGYSETSEGTWRRGGEELRVSVRPVKEGRVAVIVLRRTVVEDVLERDVREGPQPGRSQLEPGKR
ncbi:hypothetical protein BO221_39530 [Archangium sp. Cb G35]|uniref:hypothetical protein n=1 Tax=Archangium sp. Cb G35 TaxID=1920190 RepID=UPI0009361009|nr:hypothetical protein [Archangium sp. Cb G35]OJT18817.1 hypothetical protein BO221_39530 [Archangium sp. Cb G35]